VEPDRHPRGCDGWALRAESLDGRAIVSPFGGDAAAPRGPSDGLGPGRLLEEFAAAGSDSFLVHWRGTTMSTARCSGSGRWASPPGSHHPARHRPCWRRSSRTWTSAGHDRQPGFRPSTIPPDDPAKIERVRRADRALSPAASGSGWGHQTRRTAPLVGGPGPPCWWRARRSSATATAWPPR